MKSPNRIGIVGGGQLGRMMTQDAKRLGFQVVVIDPTPDCPASQVGAEQIIAELKDKHAIEKLANISSFLTFEIEHINTDVLQRLLTNGIQVNPSPETLSIIKDKLSQKQFLRKCGIPTPDFLGIETEEDVLGAAELFKYPLVLKTRFGGYDGRGNIVIRHQSEIKAALTKFAGQDLYVEQYIPLQKELAVMVARSMAGDISTYPLVETIQVNNICHMVIAPAPVVMKVYNQAEELAKKTMQHLNGAGVFGIEMFLTQDNKVLVNELAPRVHNSGHYTIEACSTSQFEQHIRAITGLPLGNTAMTVPAAVMVNILGQRKGIAEVKGLSEALKVPDASVHIYGKADTKPDRKMGHITVRANTWEEAKHNAELVRRLISI